MILEVICILTGIVVGVIGSFTFFPVTHGYDFYRPIILFIAAYFLMAGFLFGVYWLITRFMKKGHDFDKPQKFSVFLLHHALWYTSVHAGVVLKMTGKYRMPKNERYVIFSNHKSKFDPMILAGLFGAKGLAFVTKKENDVIPIGARLMRRCCYLPVDRQDRLQSLKQFNKAEELIKNNLSSVGIFPEGTRMPEDVILGDFHEGPFNVAIHTHAPIVVVTFKGTENIHKNFPFKLTKVQLDILAVIPYEEYEGKTAKALSDEIHEMMYENLKKA